MAGKHAMEALQLHHKGFNCAQAVALPFCEELGLDKDTVARGIEGFGGGLSNHESVCGALSGAVFIAGIKCSKSSMKSGAVSKADTYKLCAKLVEDFKAACGSDICPVIKGTATGKPLATCDKCILTGIDLAEKV
ncbi:MAG: C_GCAxxG_C_C family protein [Ruminococcaceae bacterium]|nr:C_GCAxxG_C_C family protein [Oscillospiraceae bacterium]